MTSVATPPVPLMLPPGLVPYRLTVDQYEAMVDAGILTEHDRLELIEGMLVKKMTKKPDRSAGSEKGRRTIDRVLIALELMASPWAYGAMAITILIDTWLLFTFFKARSAVR